MGKTLHCSQKNQKRHIKKRGGREPRKYLLWGRVGTPGHLETWGERGGTRRNVIEHSLPPPVSTPPPFRTFISYHRPAPVGEKQ